ncbi:MAG: coenzyme F420 hydrogenase, partial [Desulfovibrio sp.]
CGGCMTFCSAMQYGALELSERGRPRFRDVDNCVECGVCYMICPATHMMENQVKKQVEWTPPMGLIQEVAIVRAKDEEIRKRATDGGAVTAILTHLMDKMEIDGAAVTRQLDPFRRQPWLATNREEILESAGSNFDRSHSGSITLYTQDYTTYSPSVKALGPIAKKGLGRVALVGTPCQIMTVRKMETLGVVPSQSIYCTLGLFCSGNYSFGDRRREKIERMGDFKWSDLEKINIKDDLIIRLNNGEVLHIPLDELDFIKRRACQFCDDYGAEYADISFGGIGAEDGWTTVIARTSKGVRILSEAMNTVLEAFPSDKGKSAYGQVLEAVERLSQAKKDNATKHRQEQEEPELEPA